MVWSVHSYHDLWFLLLFLISSLCVYMEGVCDYCVYLCLPVFLPVLGAVPLCCSAPPTHWVFVIEVVPIKCHVVLFAPVKY